TADFVAGDFSSTLTMSGSAANIALGSNYLSGDGGDEGIFVDSVGRVGVGTNSPGVQMHVLTGGTAVGGFGSGDAFVVQDTGGGGNPVRMYLLGGSTGSAELYFGSDGDTTQGAIQYGNSDNQMTFWTNGTERMKITGTGNIGIGTTTPNQLLTVQGNINLSAATGAIYFDDVKYLYASSTNDSIVFGENAGATFTSGTTYNVALGFEAGRYASTSNADYNNYIGYLAGYNNEGRYNSFLGYQAGYNNTNSENNFIGYDAGYSNTGWRNNFFGETAGYNNIGDSNTFIGREAGYNNTGEYNLIFGNGAGFNNTGDYNNLFGADAGLGNRGDENEFIGFRTGYVNNGDYNQFIGSLTGRYLQSTTTVAIGAQALYGSHATTYISLNNVALGYRAGYASDDGSGQNILIGYQAADNLTTGNNNIIIGYDIDNVTATADNRLNIGNLLFGTGLDGTGTTLASGNIGIGTSTPNQRLSIFKNTADAAIELSAASGSTYKWTMGIDYSDAGKFKISSSSALGTNDVLIINGGGVGIGTDPISSGGLNKLTVGGGIIATSVYFSNGADIRAGSGTLYAPNSGSGSAPAGSAIMTQNDTAVTGTFSGTYFNSRNAAFNYQAAYIGSVNTGSGYTPIMVFGTQNAASTYQERMRLDTNGQLGLGTTSPNQMLSIYKSAADSAIELSSASGSTYKWTMGIDYSDGAKFKISSSSALGTNDRFVIDGRGRVGIGTASPSGILAVADGSRGTRVGSSSIQFYTEDTTWHGGMKVNTYGNWNDWLTINSSGVTVFSADHIGLGPTSLWANYIRVLSATPSGGVGIGTTTPNQKLSLYTAVASGDNAIEFSGASGSTYKWTMGMDNGTGVFKISSSSALGTNDRFAIDGNGDTTFGGDLLPGGSYTGNVSAFDLGATGKRWNALWVKELNVGTSTWSFKANADGSLGLFDAASGGGSQRFAVSASGASFGAASFSSTLTMSGTAANIALGSNFISNGGADEGISVAAGGNVTVSGTLGVTGGLTIDATTETNIESAIDTLANLTSASSLATVGTITSGTWNGTAISTARGGTGADTSAYTNGLIGYNSSAITDIDTEAELETALGSLDVVTVTASDITSANLISMLTDETGTGRAVFSISPAFSGTPTFAALTATSTVTMSGTAANIALGSNFISNGGADEGISVAAGGNVTVSGTLGVTGGLTIDATSETNIEAAIDTLANLTSASSLATVGTVTSGTWNGTAIGIAYGGLGAAFTDPNADRLMFWDDSAGAITGITTLTGASISGTTLTIAVSTSEITDDTITFADINMTAAIGSDPAFAANDTFFGSTGIIFEGGTADTAEGLLTSAVATTDKTWTLPNTTGTLITTGDSGTVTNTMLAGSIAASKLVGTDIATVGTITSGTWGGSFSNNIVTPNSVKTTGQTDEYCLTYEATGTTWEWQTCGSTSLFTDGGASTYLTATTDNFALGTTTANQALTIFRSAADSAIEFSSASAAPYKWTMGIDYSDKAKFKISSSSALGTNDRFVIDGKGYVGIGSSSPSTNLVLSDSQDAVMTFNSGSNWNAGLAFYEAGARRWSIEQIGSSDGFRMAYSGTTVLALKFGGNSYIQNGNTFSVGTTSTNQIFGVYNGAADAAIEFSSATGGTYKWTAGIDYSDGAKFKISSSSALGTNDRLTIDGAGKVGINDATPDAFFDIDTPTTFTTGTIMKTGVAGATTLSGALTGLNLDLSTSYTATGQSVTGQTITLPAVTNTGASTYNYRALSITGSAITQNTGAGTDTFRGTYITNSNITQTTGTVTSYGSEIVTGTITTGGTQGGLLVTATGVGAGTLYGANISGITAGAGTETALIIGTGWDNMIDGNGFDVTGTGAVTAASLTLTTDLTVANGGTGVSTFGGTNHILYTTAADTLSSEAAFTYNPSTDTLASTNISITTGLTFTGVGALDGVDSIDATTETTIEAAIDTLANLTSASSLATVGTITSGTWNGTAISTARGGTGADTSAYTNGLIGYNSSAITDIDTEAELETALGSLDVVTVTASDITSANLISMLTDETGTGKAIFSISPAFSGTPTFAALTATSTMTLSGTAANIALGSNFISNGGADEGISVAASGNVTVSGTLGVTGGLTIDATSETNIEAAIDTLANLTSASSLATVGTITSGTWGGSFSNNIVTPNSVKTTGQTDEYCLTYETTGTTFEWQLCASGYLASTDIDTSSELATILTNETGTGRAVFSISPAFSGTPTFAALTATSTMTLSGTAANIALGSNYLSGDGGDEGVFVDSSGNVSIGDAAPGAKLEVSGGSILMSTNNTSLLFTDTGGSQPAFTMQSDNNFVFYTTSSAGALQAVWSATARNAGSAQMVVSAAGGLSVSGTLSGAASTFSGNFTLSGSAANILLGSNYLSGDGGDEGISVDASGNVSALQDQLSVCSGGACASTANGDGTITAERAITSEEVTLGTTGSITVNWDDGNQQRVNSSTGNLTFNFSNATAGQTLRLVVCYGGAHTITWTPTIKWAGGTAPTPTSSSGKCDVFSFLYTGTAYFGQPSLNF
ncbi:MAG: hypothetical protein RLZZ480_198, partial [Candidatus Parcubacteria bacterium]